METQQPKNSGFKLIVSILIFLLLCTAGVESLETTGEQFNANRGNVERMQEEPWTMVERKGNQFMVNNSPFYFNGFNTFWLMVLGADQSTRGKVTEVFQQAASVGLTVGRTWAFNDGQWRALQKSPSVYNEEVFQALDFVVSEATKYKIRLILSLVNNWSDYGGKAQYVKWANAAGLNLTSDDDFFSDLTVKTYYKNHVKTVLTRVNTVTNVIYKDDPTIFAWELMNEPHCPSDPSGDKLQAWIQEMASYVKSIDPKHLVEIGLEGFYGPSTPDRAQTANPHTYDIQFGTDFIRNHQVPDVDFASVHVYADNWVSSTISQAHIQFIKSWMHSHIDDAEKTLRMPVVFAEFGVSSKDIGFDSSFRDTIYNTVYNILLDSAMHGGSGSGSLFWQLFPLGTGQMDDGYAIVLSKSPDMSDILSLQSKRLKNISSDCWNVFGKKLCNYQEMVRKYVAPKAHQTEFEAAIKRLHVPLVISFLSCLALLKLMRSYYLSD